MDVLENQYVFPNGHVAVVVGSHVRWETLAGVVTGYGKVEHVDYDPLALRRLTGRPLNG